MDVLEALIITQLRRVLAVLRVLLLMIERKQTGAKGITQAVTTVLLLSLS